MRGFLSIYKNLHWLHLKNVFWTWEQMNHPAVYQNTFSFNSTPRIYTSLHDQWLGGQILPADSVHSSWSFQWDGFHPQEKVNENKIKKNRSSDSGDEEFLWRNSQLLTQKSFSADFIHQNHVVVDCETLSSIPCLSLHFSSTINWCLQSPENAVFSVNSAATIQHCR